MSCINLDRSRYSAWFSFFHRNRQSLTLGSFSPLPLRLLSHRGDQTPSTKNLPGHADLSERRTKKDEVLDLDVPAKSPRPEPGICWPLSLVFWGNQGITLCVCVRGVTWGHEPHKGQDPLFGSGIFFFLKRGLFKHVHF